MKRLGKRGCIKTLSLNAWSKTSNPEVRSQKSPEEPASQQNIFFDKSPGGFCSAASSNTGPIKLTLHGNLMKRCPQRDQTYNDESSEFLFDGWGGAGCGG